MGEGLSNLWFATFGSIIWDIQGLAAKKRADESVLYYLDRDNEQFAYAVREQAWGKAMAGDVESQRFCDAVGIDYI